jgi:hypothetical protein
MYEGVSKIFETDTVRFIKLTIRPIGRHHPRRSSLPHVDRGPTISTFRTLTGSPFLSECQSISAIHAVAAKLRSNTRNSQFGLLGPVLRATTTAV